ncbi:uncharacterized protein BDW43DRAFT_323186 [Aspergillus alliaceus]|uniref:uncharacterized protein n=1 Tax=Petromyces alliaceus TaxID=209559 RepID=UPI0012A46A8A|nr:uncharacterized protein BDW43DRAFT_323186 [Aspergillus alliaceus]KAB8236921.1 hypothetical protein BDW43DRAFT_323186 [Aspergillus alliaceus]
MTAPNEIYQYSIISSLAQGICADGLPVMQLLSKGDHGLGALAGLDGEVTIIDGHVYQFTSSGGARALEPSDVTPFLTSVHCQHIPSFAIRIAGVFPNIKYRVAPPQTHPRKTLTEVVKRQTFTSAFSVVGLHLHFLSEDKKAGGQILQLNTEDANILVATIRRYRVQWPETEGFDSEVIVEPDRNVVSKAGGNGTFYQRCLFMGHHPITY